MTNEEYIANNDFNGLLEKNKRFIEVQANRYNQDYDTVKDLESIGQAALWTAISKWEPNKGPFWPHAKIYIKRDMIRFLNENSRTIRIPSSALRAYQKDGEYIFAKGNFIPETSTISINTPINDQNSTLEDVLGAEMLYDTIETIKVQNNALYKAIDKIVKVKHKDMLKMYFAMEPYTQEYTYKEIGMKYDISKEAVRQQITSVLKELKNNDQLRRSQEE